MTLREAKRRVRVRMEEPNGAWWGDKFGTDAIDTLLRALDRPTRLEREASNTIRRQLTIHAKAYRCECLWCGKWKSWLARHERKRKAAKRG